MEFKVKGRFDKKDESKSANKDKVKKTLEEQEDHAEAEDSDEESGGEGGEEDLKMRAGEDMLAAIKSGDPKKVFRAHRHLHSIHMTTGPDMDDDENSAEGGGGSDGLQPKLGEWMKSKGMKKD